MKGRPLHSWLALACTMLCNCGRSAVTSPLLPGDAGAVGAESRDGAPVPFRVDAGDPYAISTHWHCKRDHVKTGVDRATIEEMNGSYWFCATMVELESRKPIRIVSDSSAGLSEEFGEWTLEVDGASVQIRVDAEWANLAAHGWKAAEIETVVYPEVFGRSARGVVKGRVHREADLIYSTYSISRAHFAYRNLDVEQSAVVDEMIDRTHVPLSEPSRTPRASPTN